MASGHINILGRSEGLTVRREPLCTTYVRWTFLPLVASRPANRAPTHTQRAKAMQRSVEPAPNARGVSRDRRDNREGLHSAGEGMDMGRWRHSLIVRPLLF